MKLLSKPRGESVFILKAQKKEEKFLIWESRKILLGTEITSDELIPSVQLFDDLKKVINFSRIIFWS